jgi:ABC-type transport system substrate-binding protein
VRFLGDPNTLLANILAGEVDTAWPDGIGVEAALQLKQGWAAPGTGNNLLLFVDGRMSWMEFQHRAQFAEPAAARDPRVRRAFYHTIDKAAVTELETAGLGVPADSPIRPDDPRRPQFASAIPDWSLDLTLAQRILADAGWQRGADGTLIHGPTGQRMDTEIRVTNTTAHVNALAVMAESWRKVGAQVTETVIPGALSADGRYRSTYGFVGLSSGSSFSGSDGGVLGGTEVSFSCATVARPESNWTPPGNRQGYCNRAAEGLIERLQTTIPMAERTPLQVELVRLLYREDYAQLPLFWLVVPLPYARGITGPQPIRTSWTAWNIHLWDKG